MASLFTKFLNVFEKELTTLIDRVEAKGCGSAAYLHQVLYLKDTVSDYGIDYCIYRFAFQFPPGIEAPVIPSGVMPTSNRTEEADGTTDFTSVP